MPDELELAYQCEVHRFEFQSVPEISEDTKNFLLIFIIT